MSKDALKLLDLVLQQDIEEEYKERMKEIYNALSEESKHDND